MQRLQEQDIEEVSIGSGKRARSESEQPAEPGRGSIVTEPIRLLYRNPDLGKVILTVGFQMAASDFAGTIDLGPDTNQTWKDQTSATVAMFALAAGIMSYVTGPIFGRFTDSVDRRIALVVYGFITFLPTFIYWFFFPLNERVVWASHFASILAAIGRSSSVDFALSMDVTAFADRTLAAGVYYCLTNLVMVLLSVLPAFLIEFFNPFGVRSWLNEDPRNPRAILVYQAALVVAFVASACWVAKPEKRGAEDESYNDANNANAIEETTSCKCVWVWVDMLKLVKTHERLRRLMLAAFFLGMSGTISTGNDGQFFAQSLGLYRTEDTLAFDQMNVLRSVGTSLIFIPGYLLAGYIAMKSGTLKLLRGLVPVTAVLMALGAFTVLIGQMWFVPIVVAVQYMGDLYQGPLMRLAAGVARPGHIGVWLTLVGMAVEAGSMLGNTLIIAAEMPLGGHDSHLWVYYPAAGAVALLALIPLWGKPRDAIGWGAAAGSCREQFDAMMAARKAGRRWRLKTLSRKGGNGNPAMELSSKACGATASREGSREDTGAEDGRDCDLEADGVSGKIQIDALSSEDDTERRKYKGARPSEALSS